MSKITAKVRAAIRQVVAASNKYDADSVRISRDGFVTARQDADKNYSADTSRYLIAHAFEMVTPDGIVREGW